MEVVLLQNHDLSVERSEVGGRSQTSGRSENFVTGPQNGGASHSAELGPDDAVVKGQIVQTTWEGLEMAKGHRVELPDWFDLPKDWQAGLSMYHISPRSGEQKPRVTLWEGASLITAELGKKQGKGGKHEWVRGEIKSFSKASRRRILRLVATLRRTEVSCFGTLTYPDQFERNPDLVKNHLDKFFKRLLRKFPDAIVLWRMEPKTRKSGVSVGEIAPHFHLLIWNVEYEKLRQWIPLNWFQVVNSGDEKHLHAGTSVERVRSSRGVMFYTAKYICKSDSYIMPGWGRYWGVVNREMLKTIQGKRTVIEIDDFSAKTILRYMRRKASEVYDRHGKFVGRRKFPKWGYKFTLIGNADRWHEVVRRIRGDE